MDLQKIIHEQEVALSTQMSDLEKEKQEILRKAALKGKPLSDKEELDLQRSLERKYLKKSTGTQRAEEKMEREKQNAINKIKRGLFHQMTPEERKSVAFKMKIVPENLTPNDLFNNKVPKEVRDKEEYKTLQAVQKETKLGINVNSIAKLLNDCAQTNNIPIFARKEYTYTDDAGNEIGIKARQGEFLADNFQKLLQQCLQEKLKQHVIDKLRVGIKNMGINFVKSVPIINLVTKLFPETFQKKFTTAAKYERFPYPPKVVALPYKKKREENGEVTWEILPQGRKYLAPPGSPIYYIKGRDGLPTKGSAGPLYAYKTDKNGNPLTQPPPFDDMKYSKPEHEDYEFFVPDPKGMQMYDKEHYEYIQNDRAKRIQQLVKSYGEDVHGKSYPFSTEDIEYVIFNISPRGTKGVDPMQVKTTTKLELHVIKEPDGDMYIIDPNSKRYISNLYFPEERVALQEGKTYKLEIPDLRKVTDYYPKLREFRVYRRSGVAVRSKSSVIGIKVNDIEVQETYKRDFPDDPKIFSNIEDYAEELISYYYPHQKNRGDEIKNDAVNIVRSLYSVIIEICNTSSVLEGYNHMRNTTETTSTKFFSSPETIDRMGKLIVEMQLGYDSKIDFRTLILQAFTKNEDGSFTLSPRFQSLILSRLNEQASNENTDYSGVLKSIYIVNGKPTEIGELILQQRNVNALASIFASICNVLIGDYILDGIIYRD